MHPLICASTQVRLEKTNENNACDGADLRALHTVRAVGFQPYDTLTASVEQDFLAQFRDTTSRSYTPSGDWIDCPQAYSAMTTAKGLGTLTTAQVLLLVMTSDNPCILEPEERQEELARRNRETEAYQENIRVADKRRSEIDRKARGGRIDWRGNLIRSTVLPIAYRWTPLERLTAKQKLAMTGSLKAAEVRRRRQIEAQSTATTD